MNTDHASYSVLFRFGFKIGHYLSGGIGFGFLALSALSIAQTTLFIAAARDGASPALALFSSRWTLHFQESGLTLPLELNPV
jgi:hypothetical protein